MTTQTGSELSAASTGKRAGKMTTNSNQSLNHLLNFSLPPRQVQALPRRSRKYGTQHGVWNKERFVNAQYRFVMNPGGDYTVHFADPDIYFQWGDILQVIIPRTSALASTSTVTEAGNHEEGQANCPICLSAPVAPRMTKCGHIFCFPCLIHLVNTAENKWVRCPICFDSISEQQLKPVKWYDPLPTDDDSELPPEPSSSSSVTAGSSHKPGSSLRMRLIRRPQITTLALPRSATWPSDLVLPHQAPFHFLPDVFAYAKFMLATPAYLMEDLSRDLDQLGVERRSLAGMGDELGVTFVNAAEEKVRRQMAFAAGLETAHLQSAVDKAYQDQREIQERAAAVIKRRAVEAQREPSQDGDVGEVPDAYLASKGGLNAQASAFVPSKPTAESPASGAGRNSRQRKNLNPPPPSTQTYYYYQAASGLPVFLHPLDIKILLSHFSSYEAFPDAITVRIESSSEGSVNDDLRKRCKYLAHLPEGADVVFIEADLRSVVGNAGLRGFENALKTRRARRRDKNKRDDKARARAEERDRERHAADVQNASVGNWGNVYTAPLQLDRPTFDDFPESEPAVEVTPVASPMPTPAGAWGARSFASTLNGPAVSRPRAANPPRQHAVEEDWEFDNAWDDLEQRIAGDGGGRKKRGTKMVVLGSGGGRRR